MSREFSDRRPRLRTTPSARTPEATPATRTAGFSLLEVLLAVLLLGVTLVGITQAMTTALSTSRDAEQLTQATLLAASHLEEVRLQGGLLAGEEEGEFEFKPLYRWRQVTEETDLDGLFDVTVEISLASGGPPITRLRTLMFEAPLADPYGSTTGTAEPGTPGGEGVSW